MQVAGDALSFQGGTLALATLRLGELLLAVPLSLDRGAGSCGVTRDVARAYQEEDT